MVTHYWRTATKRITRWGNYFIYGAWCGYKSTKSDRFTAVLKNVTCGSCKNTTKYKEDAGVRNKTEPTNSR